MFVVRFLILTFVVAYSFSIGQIPPSGLNTFGKFAAFSFFIAAPALYLLPTYEAWKKKSPNLMSIALVNIFLGWSLLGWVFAIVWAYRKPESVVFVTSQVSKEAATPTQHRETKKCPFCAEDVLFEAIKCKHCGSTLTAQQ